MTVSRVLRNESNVSPATEEKIRTIADRLGYKANRLVRGIQSGRSGIIGIVVPTRNSFVHPIVEGAYDFFHQKDMMMSLDLVKSNIGEQAFMEQAKLINRLLESRVDGVLLLPVNEDASPLYFKEIIDRQIPLVLLDREINRLNADFVGTDDYAGGYEAAKVLSDNGCQSVVLISPGGFVSTSRNRVKGFLAGVNEYNLKLVKSIQTPDFLYNNELIDRELGSCAGEFDGIFGIADRLATSAWHTCKRLNLSIPDDVKIIGFGALNLRDPRVAISTFDQDPYTIGQNAAELLWQRIEGKASNSQPIEPRSILNKPRFIEGKSCPLATV